MALSSVLHAQPMDQRVIVKFFDPEEKSAGGIFIPERAQKLSHRATVHAVGRGKMFRNGAVRAPEVKVGDVVYVGIHSTIQVELAEGTFHVVDEDEIVAIEDPS